MLDDQSFCSFKTFVGNALSKFNYTPDDVNYINITNQYWMTSNGFFNLEKSPIVLKGILEQCRMLKTWWLPQGFCIVMNDGSMIIYNEVDDHYYSGWMHIPKPQKAPQQFMGA